MLKHPFVDTKNADKKVNEIDSLDEVLISCFYPKVLVDLVKKSMPEIQLYRESKQSDYDEDEDLDDSEDVTQLICQIL